MEERRHTNKQKQRGTASSGLRDVSMFGKHVINWPTTGPVVGSVWASALRVLSLSKKSCGRRSSAAFAHHRGTSDEAKAQDYAHDISSGFVLICSATEEEIAGA